MTTDNNKDLKNPIGKYGYTESDVCQMYRGSKNPHDQIEYIASVIGYSDPKSGHVYSEGINKVISILKKHGYDTNVSYVRRHKYNKKIV